MCLASWVPLLVKRWFRFFNLSFFLNVQWSGYEKCSLKKHSHWLTCFSFSSYSFQYLKSHAQLKQILPSTLKKCTTLNVPTCGDWLPVCFSDVWRGREHPVLVATEGPISMSWHLIHCSVCLLKLESTWTQLCEVPVYQLSTLNYPWIVTDLIHTHPHCNPTSSPADSFTQDDTCPLMPAKVGFPYPHGPLTLWGCYSKHMI